MLPSIQRCLEGGRGGRGRVCPRRSVKERDPLRTKGGAGAGGAGPACLPSEASEPVLCCRAGAPAGFCFPPPHPRAQPGFLAAWGEGGGRQRERGKERESCWAASLFVFPRLRCELQRRFPPLTSPSPAAASEPAWRYMLTS